jgi:hypothetical protein
MVGRPNRRVDPLICHCMSYDAVVITMAILVAVLAIAIWILLR